MALSVIQKTVRGLIATGILFLVAVVAMGFLSYKLSDVDYWTIHTHKVIEELKDSLSSLQDVETGQRGYLLTHKQDFLEPYNSGSASAFTHIDEIKRLTVDNPIQQQSVVALNAMARKLLAKTSEILEKSQQSPDAAGQLIATGESKKLMDAYREQIKVMIDNEDKLLQKRITDLRFAQYAIWTTTACLASLAIMLLTWVFQITRTAIQEEKRQVSELNTEIEQRKRIEKALKETTVNLASSNADLQQFAYVASHDLQEPLRAVTGFLTLLASKQAGNLDADSQRYINHAVEGAHRMRALVNDLLTYARVESRGRELKPVQLSKILDRVKLDLSAAIDESAAVIISDELPTLTGDPAQLGQLFQNLIGNAIKFRNSRAPEIRIKCQPQNNDWLFSVQDNGRGFDMEHAERIFVIFQRLQGREQASGTGIGLALCKKIVERHNGKIWVESKPDQGSTFFFTLPQVNGDDKNNGNH